MEHTVHIVLFSFNRAMQCESVLRSILEHVKGAEVKVSVLWRGTGPHREGYQLLQSRYGEKGVDFHEQWSRQDFCRMVLPRLPRPRNLYHWLKHPYIRKMDGFMPLVEHIVKSVDADIVSFNTDDNIYYRDEHISPAVFERIRRDPTGVSYRVYVGANQSDCPPLKEEEGLLSWNYYDPDMYHHWSYPFAVDGTYYDRKALLSFMRCLVYHNPVTLEAYGGSLAEHLGWFHTGLSPVSSSIIAMSLNKVDFIVDGNGRGDISPDRLNSLFLEDYHLEYDIPDPVTVSGMVPSRIHACRGTERIIIPVKREA